VKGFECFDVDVDLALVIGGPAAKEIAVACGGLKSGRRPEVERFRRLDVIVAVEKDRGLAGGLEGFRIDQRMKFGGNDLNRFKPGGCEFVGDPASGALNVGLVLALGAHAGNAQKFAQFREMPIAATLYKFCKVYIRPQGCESFPI
jgi:hypothetical protein